MCVYKRLSLTGMLKTHVKTTQWQNIRKLPYSENAIQGNEGHCVASLMHNNIE